MPRRPKAAAPTGLASDVWVLIVQSFWSQHERFAETVGRFELSGPQWGLLRTLAFGPPLSMSELARALVCDVSNITGLVDRLEKRGLVVRKTHPTDRRVKVISATAEGRALKDRVIAQLSIPPPGIAGLDPAELETLRKLLVKSLGTTALWTH